MRVTVSELESIIGRINRTAGVESGAIGSVRLYRAYGGYGVHRLANDSGGVEALLPCMTARECGMFLRGMVAGLDAMAAR